MKKRGGDHLKCVVNESTLSTAARSPFPNGEGCDTRISLFSHRQSEYTHMWKKNNDGQSLPRVGKVASGASRIGFWRYEKERGRSSQVRRLREHPIHRFSQHNAFPNGEGKEEAASPHKKEANPASLRSAAPSKGRGSRGYSLLPMEGGAPKGRRLDGESGMKKRGRSSQGDDSRKHPLQENSL